MNELFPEVHEVVNDRERSSNNGKKNPFVFRNPLFSCPSCSSKGPYKLRVVHGEIERSCLTCGYSLIPGSLQAKKIQEKSYEEQYQRWVQQR